MLFVSGIICIMYTVTICMSGIILSVCVCGINMHSHVLGRKALKPRSLVCSQVRGKEVDEQTERLRVYRHGLS